MDWKAIFTPQVSLLELFVRGSLMYLGILLVMRVFRRQKGALNAADFLVLVLVADAAQNAISADYHSVTEGAVVVGTIFFWDYVLDTLSFISRPLNHFLNGKPLLLVDNGKLQRHNMRREMLTSEDVIEQLREAGIEKLEQVKACYLETDGHFSVIRLAGDNSQQTSHKTEQEM
ncbi:MAG: DUF421 domain-containing protein [Gemmatimonas sp.]